MIQIDIGTLLAELALVVGESVKLAECSFCGRPAFMVVPTAPGRTTAGFWRAVQADPSGGIWDAPEQAVIAFSAGAKGWLAIASGKAATGLENSLRTRLASGPVPAYRLIAEFATAGISRHQLWRAARRLGVNRRKPGWAAGWVWELPTVGAAEQSAPVEGYTEQSCGGTGAGQEAIDGDFQLGKFCITRC